MRKVPAGLTVSLIMWQCKWNAHVVSINNGLVSWAMPVLLSTALKVHLVVRGIAFRFDLFLSF